ncbi:TatD family hydrolase [Vibrio sp. AK197]
MQLFDTHCHLDFAAFGRDFANQWQQANAAGIERVLLPAIGAENWGRIEQLSQRFSGVYYALGCHPYFLNGQPGDALNQLVDTLDARSERCVAIGECGLDVAIDVDSKLQERFFVQQIELAQSYQLPLIIHSRKADNRILQLLKQAQYTQGGVWHGFSGSEQQAHNFIERGFYLGIGGVITYERAKKTRQAVTSLPIERLVLETDAPDMPLSGFQSQPNHPKRLPLVLETLAQLRGVPEKQMAAETWTNSSRLFGLNTHE